jgi:hypothetical protein
MSGVAIPANGTDVMNRFILVLLLCCVTGLPNAAHPGSGGTAFAQSVNPTGRVGPPTPSPAPPGASFQLRSGPATSMGGNGRTQTLVTPSGIATASPNGNGTTTVTRTNGQVEVVNTPR